MSSVFLHSSQNASQKCKGISSSQELLGASLVIQKLRLHASTAVGKRLIPGQGTKISYAMQTNKYIVKNQTNKETKKPFCIKKRALLSFEMLKSHLENLPQIKLPSPGLSLYSNLAGLAQRLILCILKNHSDKLLLYTTQRLHVEKSIIFLKQNSSMRLRVASLHRHTKVFNLTNNQCTNFYQWSEKTLKK